MDNPSVHSDWWAKVRGSHDNEFLDPEADMPPERLPDQTGTGKAPRVASRHSRERASPAEPYPSDQWDPDLTPMAAQPDKLQGRGLGDIYRHVRAPLFEFRRLGDPSEVAVPGVEVVLENLLDGLGG
jgi:hypothetical protein